MSMWTYIFQRVILKETLVLMRLQIILTLSRAEYWLLGMALYIMRKNITYFRMCGGENNCRKVKCIWRSHFPGPLLHTCRLETTSLCLNTGLFVKIFQIIIIFREINVNVCVLCAQHVMKIIIIRTRRPKCQ